MFGIGLLAEQERKQSLSIASEFRASVSCRGSKSFRISPKVIKMLRRGVLFHRLFTLLAVERSRVSSFRFTSLPSLDSLHRSFSSKSSSSVLPGAPSNIADGGDDFTHISGEGVVDDLIFSDSSVDADASAAASLLPNLLQSRVVVYDGVCHLCHGGVKWVIKVDKDKKIKFCCLQSKAAEPYLRLCGLEREDVLRRFLFIEGPGSYHQASTAALRVLSYLPFPYSAASSFLIIPTPLRDAVYDLVAKRRYLWFGKSDDCLVMQESELLHRFIDKDELMDRKRRGL